MVIVMRKYVYLFELDSVKKTDEEIIKGQQVLYDEIVKNGNSVVLTFNQLVDSRGFFSLLDHQEYYNNLISLFECGAIKISQYGNIRTVSQYLLNTIEDEENEFIYSALPIKYCQKRLTALIKRSLMYSDLSELRGFFDDNVRTEDEVRDLFVEVENGVINESMLSTETMKEILENLYWLLSTVLRLSTICDIYIPPKDVNEYKDLRFINILKAVEQFGMFDEKLEKALELIKKLSCYGSNARSRYIREIKKTYQDESDTLEHCQYAEIVINLCYNYACEISICNISKHFNLDELTENVQTASFKTDFMARLKKEWDEGNNAAAKYLQEETNCFEEFNRISEIPDFSKAVRVSKYVDYSEQMHGHKVDRYEYDIENQRKKQKLSILKKISVRMISLLVCVFIVTLLEMGNEMLHSIINGGLDINFSLSSLALFALETLLFLLISELITSIIAKKNANFLPLSEAIGGMGQLIKDAATTISGKSSAHENECLDGIEKKESYSSGTVIDWYETKEIKKYKEFRRNNPKHFSQSEECPIADIEEKNTLKQIVRLQELYKYNFGMTYKSKYNTVVVDPIASSECDFFPYERIIPTAQKNGVVMLTKYNGKFVLLKQYRHALRGEQLSFPRGFGETGLSSVENVVKELSEEIAGVLKEKPIKLGEIVSDSGLSCGKAEVYMVDLESYNAIHGHEGIIETIEVDEKSFSDYINSGKINDGYTIGAFCMYRNKLEINE